MNGFLNALTDIQQGEANEIGTGLTDYNQKSQQVDAQRASAKNLGMMKEQAKLMAKQFNMPQGYEFLIDSVKNEDDFALAIKPILQKSGQLQSYGIASGAVSQAQDFQLDENTLSAIDEGLGIAGLDPNTLSPMQIEQRNKAREDANKKGKKDAIRTGVTTMGEFDDAMKLAGYGNDGLSKEQEMIQARHEDRTNVKFMENGIKDARNFIKDEEINKGLSGSDAMVGTMSEIGNLVENALSESFESSEDKDNFKKELGYNGLNILDVYTTRNGVARNVISQIGDWVGAETLDKRFNLKKRQIEGLFGTLLGDYIRSMSGLAVTNSEREFYERNSGMDSGQVSNQQYMSIKSLNDKGIRTLEAQKQAMIRQRDVLLENHPNQESYRSGWDAYIARIDMAIENKKMASVVFDNIYQVLSGVRDIKKRDNKKQPPREQPVKQPVQTEVDPTPAPINGAIGTIVEDQDEIDAFYN